MQRQQIQQERMQMEAQLRQSQSQRSVHPSNDSFSAPQTAQNIYQDGPTPFDTESVNIGQNPMTSSQALSQASLRNSGFESNSIGRGRGRGVRRQPTSTVTSASHEWSVQFGDTLERGEQMSATTQYHPSRPEQDENVITARQLANEDNLYACRESGIRSLQRHGLWDENPGRLQDEPREDNQRSRSRNRTPPLATNRNRSTGHDTVDTRECAGESNLVRGDERLKSGMMDKSSMSVCTRLIWPQKQLGYRFIQEPIAFNQLTFDHLVVGEIATIRACSDLFEAKHRLRLLERVGYWKLRGAEWSQVRAFYAAILAGIEADEFTWDVEYSEFETMIIDKPAISVAVKPDKKFFSGKNKGKYDTWCCKEYNSETGCNQDSGHMITTMKGDQKQALHICSKCWRIKKVRAEHAETAAECPLKQ